MHFSEDTAHYCHQNHIGVCDHPSPKNPEHLINLITLPVLMDSYLLGIGK